MIIVFGVPKGFSSYEPRPHYRWALYETPAGGISYALGPPFDTWLQAYEDGITFCNEYVPTEKNNFDADQN